MADFPFSSIEKESVGTSGVHEASKRLLGDDGALATGNGGWYRTRGLWKTFMLYINDRKTALGAGVVQIDACMELASDPDNPDTDTQFVTLVTLDSTTKSFSTEHPWRYVRARVTTADINALQVGLNEQGGG